MILKNLLTLGINEGNFLVFLIGNFVLLMFVAIVILLMVELWIIFKKAGRPGWHALIPIYSVWVMYEIAGMHGWFGWMVILSIVPIAGLLFTIIFSVILCGRLVKTFGKSPIFTIGLIFLSPIFYGILAFSKRSVYIGVDINQDCEIDENY